ncbi:YbjN domain-containing protein [Floridanema aerugineum]|uniref:YbjN domain-containing protein n=1 Tax=Floridaenema aerugineum BLCC-F46 TaxID=3153654 RepID=A0ABV4X3K0_9CYAN
MIATNENSCPNKELILRDPSASNLTLWSVNLALNRQEDTLSECRFTFKVSPELYQRVNTQGLFNLKPELHGPFAAGNFQAEADIEITAIVRPDLLPQLTNLATNPDEALTYLQNLSQEQPDNLLLSTESWFCSHVQQSIESATIGYCTFWSYVSPSIITQEANSNGQVSQAIIQFIKDWSDADMSKAEETISQSLEEMTKVFEQLADTGLAATEEAISEVFAEFNNAFTELADTANEALVQEATDEINLVTTSRQIFEEIVNFFTKDDWAFFKIKGEPTLRLAFQGKNGKWTCYAKAREQQQQFVFYSICPDNAPENKRLAVAEFLTRANSGMIIGNFEMDFEYGEIRYKTSIDVEGDRLSFALIKRLVYANVTMMDEYLPGIMSIIYGEAEAGEAIAKIET